jgi:hypothetical protein
MRRLLVAAALAVGVLAPAAHACDLNSCVQNLPVCDLVLRDCRICYQNEYEHWCIPG